MIEGANTIEPLLAYYGDDFTGSTDVLEALTYAGIGTVLFVTPPTSEMLERYPNARAFGIAGASRAMSPEAMDAVLPDIFARIRTHNPRFAYYKVSSTFDSSPNTGSIGRAIEIGQKVFQNRLTPVLAAAPRLGRYCAFGNLFARSGLGTEPYRLDRHPTMSFHPTTPMDEADLRVHLAKQTSKSIGLVDVLALERGSKSALDRLTAANSSDSILLFDCISERHLSSVGASLDALQACEHKPLFIVGSSGMIDALAAHWRAEGTAKAVEPRSNTNCQYTGSMVAPAKQAIVVSGSCSPVTDRQIAWALARGFADAPIDTAAIITAETGTSEVARLTDRVVSALSDGKSVVVHSSRGPNDPRIKAATSLAISRDVRGRLFGEALGRVLRDAIRDTAIRRVGVAGGDTSSHVARILGIESLEMIGPLEPGAPLCRAFSSDPAIKGLEITFKGGQVGYDDFFGTLLRGRPKDVPGGETK